MNQYQRAPIQAIAVWQLRLILAAFLPAFLLFFFYAPQRLLWWCFVILAGAAFLFFSLFWIPIKYWRLSYRMDNQAFYLRHGVIYNRYSAISRKQLQYITTFSTPLQRKFSLCTVVMVMAGAHMLLPCIAKEEGERICRWSNLEDFPKQEENPA